jgi:hypothetical protein
MTQWPKRKENGRETMKAEIEGEKWCSAPTVLHINRHLIPKSMTTINGSRL